MSSYTADPWIIRRVKDHVYIVGPATDEVTLAAKSECIAEVFPLLPGGQERAKANARLLVKAPDLFRAWQGYLSDQKTINQSDYMDNYQDAARARKRQAERLAKIRDLITEITKPEESTP